MFWPTLQLPFLGRMYLGVIMGREGYVCLAKGSDGSQYICALRRAASTSCSLFLLHLTLYRRQDNRELKIDTNEMWLIGNIIQDQYMCVHTPWPGQHSDMAVNWTTKELKFNSLEEQEVLFFPNASRPTPGTTKPPIQKVMWALPQGTNSWGMRLTNRLHLVLRIRMTWVILPLPI
jgi:hypothetical protein